MYTPLPDPGHQAGFYAGVPVKRALAWVVDASLIAIMAMIVVLFTLFLSLFFLPALYLTISFLYRTITLARHSATPGMQLMAIEFRDRSGAKFDLGTAFLHTLGYTLTISTVLLQLLSMGLMLTTARGQGLTDLVLGTVAINKPARN
jgi:uncharacterized RDD family membrane protein YckC